MVEIKSIQVFQKSFLGIQMQLPGYPLFLLMSTKVIMAQNMFDIAYFEKENNISVVILDYRYGFEAMLDAPVIAVNEVARLHGVALQMRGKEALLLCETKE